MADKRALKEQYKQMKPDMGVFVIRSKNSNHFYLEATRDLKSRMNGALFKLNAGSYLCKSLQNVWRVEKEDSFVIEVMERLDYRDDNQADYQEELEVMKSVLEEELIKDGLIPYGK